MSIARIAETIENPSVTQLLAAYPTKDTFDAAVRAGKIKPTTEAGIAANIFNRIVSDVMARQAQSDTTVLQDLTAPQQMPPKMGLGAIAPQGQGQGQAATGLSQIPIPENMFEEREMGVPGMADGGIVAFQRGGNPAINYEDEIFKSGLGKRFREQQMLRERILGEDQSVADLMSYVQGLEGKAAGQAERMFNLRLAQAGLGIAAGQSPYFAANLAGAMPALEAAAGDIAKREEAELGRKKVMAELGGRERAEKAKVLESAIAEGQAEEKLVPETIRAARALQDEARDAGRKVPTLAQAIKSIERTTGSTTLQAAFVNAQSQAAKAVGDLVNSSTFQQKYKSISKKDGPEAAEAYKKQSIRETVGLFPGVRVDEVMSSLGIGATSRPKPTIDQFLDKAKKANPGVSEEALKKFYNEKYGQ